MSRGLKESRRHAQPRAKNASCHLGRRCNGLKMGMNVAERTERLEYTEEALKRDSRIRSVQPFWIHLKPN